MLHDVLVIMRESYVPNLSAENSVFSAAQLTEPINKVCFFNRKPKKFILHDVLVIMRESYIPKLSAENSVFLPLSLLSP